MKSVKNRQSAAKPLLNEEGSTTIPVMGSTGDIISGKQPVYLRKRDVIYIIINLVNGKFYIGSASYYDKRIGTHVSRLRKNKHANPYLQNAWNKYGEENFRFEIIEEVSKLNLIEREQFWLDFTQCYDREIGYNISKIAERSGSVKRSKKFKENVGNYWRGKKFSKKRILQLRKRSAKLQGKSVVQYDKNMNYINEFPSISEASRTIGISGAAISKFLSKSIQGRFKSRRSKFIFKYKDIV